MSVFLAIKRIGICTAKDLILFVVSLGKIYTNVYDNLRIQ